MKNVMILITAVGLVTACGGGGGGGGSKPKTPEPELETTPIEEPVEIVTEAATNMQQLQIPDEFDYQPFSEFNLEVDISSQVTQRAFVSVYTQFQLGESGAWTADYDSKVASQALAQGTASLSFTSAEHVPQFLVEIWTYDGSDPLQKVITADSDTLYW